MPQIRKCVSCGHRGKLKQGSSSQWIRLGRVSFEGELPAMICPQCDETYVNGKDLERFELLVAKQLAEHAQRTPEAFRFMRKVLGMKASDLAPLIGIRTETLSRYENGAVEIDPVRFAVLAMLVADRLAGNQEAGNRFRAAMAPVKKMPPKVALKVA